MAAPELARARAAQAARFLRLVRPAVRRTPSVRVWDRLEAVLILILSALLIGSVPICWSVASSVYAGDQSADARLGARYQVTAKLFPGPSASHRAVTDTSPVVRHVRATWTAPDGTPRAGDLDVEVSPAGPATVGIWVDRAGARTPAPRTLTDLLFVAVMYGLSVEFAAVVAAALVYAGAWLLLDRGRARGWDRAWRRLAEAGKDA